ncbi:MAG: DMT family transporter, partial [Hyphomonadaceae bacterium]|nr:DMT family transporter [Hyphomonadaceae bacterium]
MTVDRPTPIDWAYFALCVVLWGSAYACVRVALMNDAQPWTIVAGRLWLGAGGLLCLLWLRRGQGKEPPPTPRSTGKLMALGLVGATTPFALLSWSQTQIESGLVGILAALTPILVGVAAPFVLPHERLTLGRVAGLVLGFAGVVVLVGPEALAGLGGAGVLGELAAAGAAAAYAVNALMARRGVEIPPLEAAAGWTLWGAIFATPFAIWTWAGPPGALAWVMIAVLALGASGVASIAYFELLKSRGPNFVSQTNYVLPLFAV